jgi:hypothetical protein
MKRMGILLLLATFVSCGSNNAIEEEEGVENGFDYEGFSNQYKTALLPYQLSDTGLLKNKDTVRVKASQFSRFVSDSLKKKAFGKTTGIRFIPLDKIESKNGENYFLTKGVSGNKIAAFLTVIGKGKDTGVSFPFLIPDANATTSQVSVIDKAYSISRNVTQREKNDILIEGKDVYAFNTAVNNFTLIMTDVLDEKNQELINPIDTFSRRHKFSGDYVRDKRNLVSIRDGRNENELNMFVHFEKEDGEEDCTGELKGTLFFTSSTTAVYRQGGDPCVMEFRFTPNAVTLKEEEGCGRHRGLKCVFDDTYRRKDAAKTKASSKKARKN